MVMQESLIGEFDLSKSDTHKACKIVYPILAIAWMGLIFFMSSRNGEQSSSMSDTLCMWIGSIFIKSWKMYTASDKAAFVESISFCVRKTAHMTEYAILMVFVYQSFRARGKCGWKAFFLALAICAAYAASDELHQMFVGERSPQVRDVMIDTCGAAIGGLLVRGFGKYCR